MDYLKIYLVIDKENILNKIKNINNNFTKNEYYIYITNNGIIKKFNGILKYLILHEDSELYNELQINNNNLKDENNTLKNELNKVTTGIMCLYIYVFIFVCLYRG